jgi:hypothetical protein
VVDGGDGASALTDDELRAEQLRDALRRLPFDLWRRLVEPHELRVRVREAGAGGAPLVDERVEVAEPVLLARQPAERPRLGDQPDLVVVEVGERANVVGRVDDDLLARERRIEVRDDADAPAGAVAPGLTPECQCLGRRSVLAPFAERARVELLGRRFSDPLAAGARPASAIRRDDDEAP